MQLGASYFHLILFRFPVQLNAFCSKLEANILSHFVNLWPVFCIETLQVSIPLKEFNKIKLLTDFHYCLFIESWNIKWKSYFPPKNERILPEVFSDKIANLSDEVANTIELASLCIAGLLLPFWAKTTAWRRIWK